MSICILKSTSLYIIPIEKFKVQLTLIKSVLVCLQVPYKLLAHILIIYFTRSNKHIQHNFTMKKNIYT